MPRRIQLEVFELTDMTEERVELGQAELEECRLAAYEQGYTAGWDDAVAAQDTEVARLRSDLGQNLLDLSFTYREAHSHVLRGLEPLLRDMVAKVLPELGRGALGRIVLEQLEPFAKDCGDTPITLVANPANRTTLESLMIAEAPFPMVFLEEPSLGDGQVYLRLGNEETQVDLDAVVAAISSAVSAFFRAEKHEERRHG